MERSAHASALCLLALALAAGTTTAQEGGGGRALERDLRVGAGPGLAPRRNFYNEVQLRNALITGNVGGGRSFRGSVGYTAPGEFRGSLGTDSTYEFRRDASSPSTLTRLFRGGDSLRYQFGGSTGTASYAPTITSRLGATGRAASQAAPGTLGTLNLGTGYTFSDRAGASSTSSLRSTSSYLASQSLRPTVITRFTPQGEARETVGSSLLGVRDVRSPERSTRPGEKPELRPGEQPSIVQPMTNEAVNTMSTSVVENLAPKAGNTRTVFDELRSRQLALVRRDSREQEDAASPAGITRRADEPAETTTARTPDWEARLDNLRQRLLPPEQRLDATQTGMKSLRDKVKEDLEAARAKLDNSTLDIIRRSAGQTEQFVAPAGGGDVDLFTQHMQAGQDLMSQARFFDAEERFVRALASKPGDPTAMAGRLHAQLGAGLYLSAGLNLRDLFTRHPEMMAMRYAGSTIPANDRLISIAADLRGRIARTRDTNQLQSIDEGLLLAYLAFQLGDRRLTVEGLDAAESADKQRVALGEPHDTLCDVLRRVWVPATFDEAPATDGGGTP